MAALFTQKTFQDAAGISSELAAKWHYPLSAAFPLAEINSAERIALVIAECGHESAGFTRLEESLNYTPQALKDTFNKGGVIRFTDFDALKYGRVGNKPADQKMIGILAYGGRMGNKPAPSTDGYDYRGFGIIQGTGADNWRAFLKWLRGIHRADYVATLKPQDLAENPVLAAEHMAWYWQSRDLNKWADARDVLTCSRVINCGSATTKATPNGLQDRLERYKRAIKVMTGRA